MIVKIPLQTLRELDPRFPGIFQTFMEAGRVEGSVLAMNREDFDRLNHDYFKGIRLGTFAQMILKPVVKVVDKVTGADLGTCANCTGREMKLNAL